MNWNKLENISSLENIKSRSYNNPVVIFKHSIRCSISSMALDRLSRSWDEKEMTGVEIHYLDLISYRDISNQIVEVFNIAHESPQVLIIKDGECVYDNSHMGISYREIKGKIKELDVSN